MTTPTPEQARRRAERIVERARAVLADPNNMDVRRDYMRAVFNIDWTAAAIVALADQPSPSREGEAPVAWAVRHPEDPDELEWAHCADPHHPPLTEGDYAAGWTAEPLFAAAWRGEDKARKPNPKEA